MTSKEIYFGQEARKKLLKGMIILSNAVQETLGPKGRNVIIEKSYGNPIITKDGVTVAKEIELEDRVENMGAQLVKEVTSQTSDNAGDGTTTATVLAKVIAIEGNKYVSAGINPMDLKRGIDLAVSETIKHLKEMSVPCIDEKSIAQVGTVSANSDEKIGSIIANSMKKVGKEGVITVEDGNSLEDELEIVEGMQFDRGFISPYFVTNKQNMTCELENPFILITDKKINNIREMITTLEAISKSGRPLFIISEDIEGEALATLVVNSMRGIVKICAVKAPGFGDRKKSILEDLAILTDSSVISEDIGLNLENINIEQLGSAKKIIVNKDNTTIINGEGNKSIIKERIKQISSEIENSNSDYDKEKLQERIAKLSDGVAIIKVGAATEIEMKEKKARVEDALHATRAAVQEGVLPGGGIALLNVQEKIKNLKAKNEDQNNGIKIIIKALEAPINQIIKNTGTEPSIIVEKIKNNKSNTFGYNAYTGEFGDMFKFGILDPTKVTRSALQNAASVASLMITTECTISEIKKENNDTNKNNEDLMGQNQGMF